MAWKIFAVLSAVFWAIGIAYILAGPIRLTDLIGAALSLVATIGVLGFSFRVAVLGRSFWWAFTLAYAVWLVISITIGIASSWIPLTSGSLPVTLGTAFGILFGSAIIVVQCLGLWRYSSSPMTPLQS
jgi:hypothetical protein